MYTNLRTTKNNVNLHCCLSLVQNDMSKERICQVNLETNLQSIVSIWSLLTGINLFEKNCFIFWMSRLHGLWFVHKTKL